MKRLQAEGALQSGDVGRSRTLVSLFDVEFDFLSLFEVRAANVFHVEENVLVLVLSIDETVTASVVEEINRSFRHCIRTNAETTDNSSGMRTPGETAEPRDSSSLVYATATHLVGLDTNRHD